MQYFLGFKMRKSQFVHETLDYLWHNLYRTDFVLLFLGLAWWFMLSASRRLSVHPKFKKKFSWLKPCAPLIVCVLGVLLAGNWSFFNGCGFVPCNATLESNLTVGAIEGGVSSMGSAHLLDLSPASLARVLSTAVSCAIIGYMESIGAHTHGTLSHPGGRVGRALSPVFQGCYMRMPARVCVRPSDALAAIAKSLAAKHKYEVNATQELFALGVANMLGSLTSAYPVTGSFSRSAVNNQVGAKTQLAGLVTGCLLLLTLLLLTPYFYFLPKFALAAIVIASVTNLVDYKEALHLWKVKKQDCGLWMVAFLGTLFLGVQLGLLLSVGTSLALVIMESIRPQMMVLWRLPSTPIYRNIKQESAGQFVPVTALGGSNRPSAKRRVR